MISKRDEKKKVYIDKILVAAKKVFFEYGYEAATIGQIAKEAGVGRGTAYLYFSSKSELFRETMKDVLNINNLYEIFEDQSYQDKASEHIKLYLKSYVDLIFGMDEKLLREFAVSLRNEPVTVNSFTFNFLVGIDNKILDRLAATLTYYVEKGSLIEEFDVEVCADFILKIMIEVFDIRIRFDTNSKSDVIDRVCKQVDYLLKPYEKQMRS